MINPDFFLISALIDFLLVNVVLSTLALGVERLTRRRLRERWTARRRSRFLYLAATLPFVLSVLIIAGLQIPAQLLYEPHEPEEYVTLKIFAIAFLGLLGIAYAGTRQLASWWLTVRFNRKILGSCKTVSPAQAPTALPVFKIKHALPLCCILGVRRPKLFLADQLFRTLDKPELRGALAHEEAHWRHHDNLKSAILSFLSSFFFFLPTYRRLEEAWRDADELACDEEAAEHTQRPLDLASALVKIAKLTPAQAPAPALLLAGLGLTDFSSSARLEQRVTRLLALADRPPAAEAPWRPSIFSLLAGSGAVAAFVILVTEHNLLYSLHRGIEVLEHFFM